MMLQQAFYTGRYFGVRSVCTHTHWELFPSSLSSFVPPHRCTYPYLSHHTDAHTQTAAAHAPTSPNPHALAVAVTPSPSLLLSSGGTKGQSALRETPLRGRCTAGTTSPCGWTNKWGGRVTTLTIHICADRECL